MPALDVVGEIVEKKELFRVKSQSLRREIYHYLIFLQVQLGFLLIVWTENQVPFTRLGGTITDTIPGDAGV